MKGRSQAVWIVVLVFALVATAGAAPARFSLDRYSQSPGPALKLGMEPPLAAETSYLQGAEAKKRPWIAALETFSFNIGLWLFDRYALNKDFSHISWSTMKYNLQHGFVWDDDAYSESFIGHPYQGSQFFNTARSLGLNFWESIPYTTAGYLMWGFFLENDQPSYNDTVITTLGGINLGELEYRLSSQVLDDSATGGARIGREILAFLIDPLRGLNRLIYGDMFRMNDINQQKRESLQGNLTFSAMLVSDSKTLSHVHFSPGLTFDMVYGLDSSDIVTDHPFDLIFFTGEFRYSGAQSRGYFNLSTYGQWYAKEWDGKSGQHFALGLFQHYDFLNNEAFQTGGTSTTLGFVSVLPLGRGAELRFSIQAGGLLLSGTRTDYILVDLRDYDYSWGFTGKVDVWLIHPTLGTINLHFKHFQSWSIEAAEPAEADENQDIIDYFSAQYSYPITDTWAICLDFSRFALRQHFEGHPEGHRDSSRIGLAVGYHF